MPQLQDLYFPVLGANIILIGGRVSGACILASMVMVCMALLVEVVSQSC